MILIRPAIDLWTISALESSHSPYGGRPRPGGPDSGPASAVGSRDVVGRLSYSDVCAITRVVRSGEEQLVNDLVTVAQHGTVRQLESMVRGLRTIEDNDPPETPSDYLAHSWGGDSRWRMQARLDPESGAVVEAALKGVASKENLSAAQALVRMSEIAQAALNDSGTPPRALRGDERAAVLIHLDAAALPQPDGDDNGSPEPVSAMDTTRRPYARIADGPGLPDNVVQRLLCNGRVRTVLWVRSDDRSDLLDLGRSHRVVSSANGTIAPTISASSPSPASASGRFQFLRPDRRVLPDVVDPSAFIRTATPLGTNTRTSPRTPRPAGGPATDSTTHTPSPAWPPAARQPLDQVRQTSRTAQQRDESDEGLAHGRAMCPRNTQELPLAVHRHRAAPGRWSAARGPGRAELARAGCSHTARLQQCLRLSPARRADKVRVSLTARAWADLPAEVDKRTEDVDHTHRAPEDLRAANPARGASPRGAASLEGAARAWPTSRSSSFSRGRDSRPKTPPADQCCTRTGSENVQADLSLTNLQCDTAR